MRNDFKKTLRVSVLQLEILVTVIQLYNLYCMKVISTCCVRACAFVMIYNYQIQS